MSKVDLSDLLEGISDALLVISREWRIVHLNSRAAQIAERESSALVGEGLWSAYPELVGTPAEMKLLEAMASGQCDTFELFLEARRRWFEVRLLPVVNGLAIYLLDITGRHEAEATMRPLYAASFIGVLSWCVDGRITAANDTFLRMLGYTRAELDTGQLSWIALTPPEFWHLDALGVHRLRAEGESLTYEKEYLRKDGSRVPVLVASAALDPTGRHSVAIVIDLTERKRFEILFQRAQRHQAVANLAGGMAHEINNMMAAVVGYGHLVLESMPAASTVRNDVQQILTAGRRAADITQQILAFSRQQLLAPMALDVGDVLVGLQPVLAPMLGPAATLEIDVADGLPQVQMDRHRLEQTLVNLVDNARRAMTSGGIVCLRARSVTLDETALAARNSELVPGAYVALAVEDTGTGIDPATLARVLEPFVTTREVGEGSGLGLPSAVGLMRQSGGDLWINSILGGGTTVTLLFPVIGSTVKHGLAAPALAGSSSVDPLPAPADRPAALVVEDELIIRAMIRRALTRAGLTVIEAGSGREALRKLARNPRKLSLVISDLVMPGGGGRGLVDQLRLSQPGVPILFLSGYSEGELSARDDLKDGEQLLFKPFAPATLVAAARALLGAGAPTRPPLGRDAQDQERHSPKLSYVSFAT